MSVEQAQLLTGDDTSKSEESKTVSEPSDLEIAGSSVSATPSSLSLPHVSDGQKFSSASWFRSFTFYFDRRNQIPRWRFSYF